MSKHPGIQAIMVKTAKEYKIKYECGTFAQMYKELIETLKRPRYLGESIGGYYK